MVSKPMSWLLQRFIPGLIFALTDWLVPGGAEFPDASGRKRLEREAREGGEARVRELFGELRDEARDVNTRCATVAPASTLILTIAGVLRTSLNNVEALYWILVTAAGTAAFFAVAAQSVRVGPGVIGAPTAAELPDALIELQRKEAYTRVAAGLAGISIVLLGVTAFFSR